MRMVKGRGFDSGRAGLGKGQGCHREARFLVGSAWYFGTKCRSKNLATIRKVLEDAGVIFIDEDEEGPGVRLRKTEQQ